MRTIINNNIILTHLLYCIRVIGITTTMTKAR